MARLVSIVEDKEFIFKKLVYIDNAESDSPYVRLNLLAEKTISSISFSTETFMRFNRRRNSNGRLSMSPSFDDSRNIFVLNKARVLTWFNGYERTVDNKQLFELYSTDFFFGNTLYYKNINFENFSYLRSFMDYVIDYRVQNNMEEITEEELNDMVDQFVKWYMSEDRSKDFVLKLERK